MDGRGRADTYPQFHLYPYELSDFISEYRQKYVRIGNHTNLWNCIRILGLKLSTLDMIFGVHLFWIVIDFCLFLEFSCSKESVSVLQQRKLPTFRVSYFGCTFVLQYTKSTFRVIHEWYNAVFRMYLLAFSLMVKKASLVVKVLLLRRNYSIKI